MCEFKYTNMKLNGSKKSSPTTADPNRSVEILEWTPPSPAQPASNNNNYKESFKQTFSTLGNDLKTLINGLGGNNPSNSSATTSTPFKKRSGYDDVIEIDPKTNKPVPAATATSTAVSKSKSVVDLPTVSSSGKLWTCRACTYKTNPEWAVTCEMCETTRPNVDHSSKIQTADENNDLITPDPARQASASGSWKCKRCTFINSDKTSSACQACDTPRAGAADSSSKKSNSRSPDRWICRVCTYNNNTGDHCMLCNSVRNDNSEAASRSLLNAKDWKCEVCSSKNRASANTCAVCENDRAGRMRMEFENEPSAANKSNVSPSSATSAVNSSLNNSLMTRSSHTRSAKKIDATFTTATQEAERTWTSIARYCKAHGIRFVDDSFPPCDKSLFIDVRNKPKNYVEKSIVWLNAENIASYSRERWCVYNNPSFSDIKQGVLGERENLTY
jgi:hypothetical protein